MQIEALTGITAHGCDSNPYWWIIPTLLIVALAVRALFRHVSDRRADRRTAELAKRIGQSWADNSKGITR
jgi:hypothetical protein